MLQVYTSQSVSDEEYPESRQGIEQTLARKALSLRGEQHISNVLPTSLEILDALSTWAWSDFNTEIPDHEIDEWLNQHSIVIFLTNKMRNICTQNPDWSYTRAHYKVVELANLEES